MRRPSKTLLFAYSLFAFTLAAPFLVPAEVVKAQAGCKDCAEHPPLAEAETPACCDDCKKDHRDCCCLDPNSPHCTCPPKNPTRGDQ